MTMPFFRSVLFLYDYRHFFLLTIFMFTNLECNRTILYPSNNDLIKSPIMISSITNKIDAAFGAGKIAEEAMI